ncbi:MAG: hypothetical protein R3C59_08950 [Planctomycetaceae bacterium]
MYDELKALILSDGESDVQCLSDEQVSAILAAYPDVPEDYLAYLVEIGWGAIAMSFVIYNGPKSFSDVYLRSDAPDTVVLIGDNMAGKCMGYDTSTWDIVEVLPGGVVQPLNTKFEYAIGEVCKELFEEVDD